MLLLTRAHCPSSRFAVKQAGSGKPPNRVIIRILAQKSTVFKINRGKQYANPFTTDKLWDIQREDMREGAKARLDRDGLNTAGTTYVLGG
jgi:hypothetical protein